MTTWSAARTTRSSAPQPRTRCDACFDACDCRFGGHSRRWVFRLSRNRGPRSSIFTAPHSIVAGANQNIREAVPEDFMTVRMNPIRLSFLPPASSDVKTFAKLAGTLGEGEAVSAARLPARGPHQMWTLQMCLLGNR
jgi:hypothetical protein